MATVHLNGTLRGAAGLKVVEVDGAPDATVADILALLVANLPVLVPEILGDDGNLRSNIAIFRNGRNIRLLDNLETRVSSDQTLDLFPKIGAYRVFGS
ncbi:MAG: MoaD/ThiS family protein [Anaerolineae bacterium]|nr:MoaD/ThiS family protein [Anaerolineae bacterium]MCB0241408.1 MoaD/ThiS family protein [Anaerolineae bacterium]MCB0250780.1 MoaD/ThiS family protein [Anaerolineae bacterium]MCB9140864.1 MoaD/ThiS family protein [Anaerolineales bacterium]MCO5246231.1 MoaD/ThiS family protein [Anaerolineae bacterium]